MQCEGRKQRTGTQSPVPALRSCDSLSVQLTLTAFLLGAQPWARSHSAGHPPSAQQTWCQDPGRALLIQGLATAELSLLTHAHSRARPGPLFAALTSRTIIGSPCPLLSSNSRLSPAGHKLTAKPSPVKVGEKLVTKSSVRVGEKRKASDETPCQAKVRVRTVLSALGCWFGPGLMLPTLCS